MAEETLRYNADSEILLLTGTTYVNDAENVTIVDVSDRYEWNVAVLKRVGETRRQLLYL